MVTKKDIRGKTLSSASSISRQSRPVRPPAELGLKTTKAVTARSGRADRGWRFRALCVLRSSPVAPPSWSATSSSRPRCRAAELADRRAPHHHVFQGQGHFLAPWRMRSGPVCRRFGQAAARSVRRAPFSACGSRAPSIWAMLRKDAMPGQVFYITFHHVLETVEAPAGQSGCGGGAASGFLAPAVRPAHR